MNKSLAKFKRILKLLLLVILVILAFFWNFAIIMIIALLLNAKTIYKSLLGKIPLEVNDDDYRGPNSYTYKKENNKYLSLDIYYPAKSKKMVYPAVFFTHGGGWISGYKRQPNNVSWLRYLASKGFAVISIDYNFCYSSTMDDILNDYGDALKYVRENARKLKIDTNNIALMGLSAGGQLSLLFSAQNTHNKNFEIVQGIKCVISWYAPCDLMDIWNDGSDSLFARFAITTTLKGLPKKQKEAYKQYSPINWVTAKMLPSMLVHGTDDTVVPAESSIKMYEELRRCNVPSTLRLIHGADHGFEFILKNPQTIKVVEQAVSFLRKHLK
ncbi:MAG: alpha/beta hydrolase [Thermotogota bacterium]|nr:alpha/beta hydrolase [Thermotogota bacterium]